LRPGRCVIGIDLGGTNIRAALVDERGSVRQRHCLSTGAADGVDAVVSRLVEAARTIVSSSGEEVEAIGIGAPGLVDPSRGVVRIPPNLPGWGEVPLASLIEGALGYPTRVGNDTNMVTLAEWMCGAGRGARHMVCLTLGTGVGGGLVLDSQLYLGARGAAAEIGHMTVEPQGPLCNCGNRGCLESLVGASAIAERARMAIERGEGEEMRRLSGGDHEQLTPEIVARAAECGDEAARRVLYDVGVYLGIALASIVNLLDPEIIVIGGGISHAGDLILEPARAAMEERAMRLEDRHVSVVPAALGDDGGVIGAALFALGDDVDPVQG